MEEETQERDGWVMPQINCVHTDTVTLSAAPSVLVAWCRQTARINPKRSA